jgi:uncharacterized protein (TIGR00251 family)
VPDKINFTVFVKPSSKKAAITLQDDIVQVSLKSSPTKGKANKELIELLAKTLDIQKSRIYIQRGLTSSTKILAIKGINMENWEEMKVKFQQSQMMQ